MEHLTGLSQGEALGRSLVHDLAEGTSRHTVGWDPLPRAQRYAPAPPLEEPTQEVPQGSHTAAKWPHKKSEQGPCAMPGRARNIQKHKVRQGTENCGLMNQRLRELWEG